MKNLLTNYLRSTSCLTDVSGELLQADSYYPFGMIMDGKSYYNTTLDIDNKNFYLYNGKELQTDFDLDWYDYGARMYDAQLGRFHTQDPKLEMYYLWSPYNFVGNNPIRRTDPTGMIWADTIKASNLINAAQNQIDYYNKRNTILDKKIAKANSNGNIDKAVKLYKRKANNLMSISELQNSIVQITEMWNNENFVFDFVNTDPSNTQHVSLASNGTILIDAGTIGQQLHETRHAYLYMDDVNKGGHKWIWSKNKLAPNGPASMLDWVAAEISAYRVQYAYSSTGLDGLSSIYGITADWVANLEPYTSMKPYIEDNKKYIDYIKRQYATESPFKHKLTPIIIK